MYIEIKTERMLLRPLCVDDLYTTHAYASDAESTRYMLHLPNHTLTETRQFLVWAANQWTKEESEDYELQLQWGENISVQFHCTLTEQKK